MSSKMTFSWGGVALHKLSLILLFTIFIAQIDLCLRMAGDESRMAGDCCRTDGIPPDLYIDAYPRIHTCDSEAHHQHTGSSEEDS